MRDCLTHSLTRRSVLKATGAAVVAGLSPVSAPSAERNHRVPFGAALEYSHFLEDSDYTALFVQYCDLIFPMNALKWDQIHYEEESYNFLPSEGIVGFADRLQRGSYGHTFVWWNAIPPWVEAISSRADAEAALVGHIRSVAGHFSDRVSAWDVVNEVIAHDPREDGVWRDSVWMRLLGPEHVDIAFAAVAEAAPGVQLNINDYDLEGEGPRYDARRAAILDLVRHLQKRGSRVDAVGLQGHLYPEVPIDAKGLGRFIADLQALGVNYRITELDVIDWKLPADIGLRDEMAAKHVDRFLDAAFSAALPLSVSTWGLSDRYSWVGQAMPHRGGVANRPLPFDVDLKPKPMFGVIERYVNA